MDLMSYKVPAMKILTLWIPVALLIGAIIDGFHGIPWYLSETGVVENLTVVFLVIAIIQLLRYACGYFKTIPGFDKLILVVLVLGSTYFAGEEMSWGQHWIGFQTPGNYGALNYQGEMNLHNLEHGFFKMMFDRLPRALITLGIFAVGIVLPFRRSLLPQRLQRYIPGKELLFISLLAVFVTVPNKIMRLATSGQSGFDAGEMKELYIALFILMFSLHFLRSLQVRREEVEGAGLDAATGARV